MCQLQMTELFSLVLTSEQVCSNQREVPLCVFNGVLRWLFCSDDDRDRQGSGAGEGVTYIIIESVTRVFLAWLWGFCFNSFCFPFHSFAVLPNSMGISEGEELAEPSYVRRKFVY